MITRQQRFAIALLLIGLLLPVSYAQSRKAAKGPRALAVLETTPQGLRLVPISMVIEGKFYDAGLYRANPVPFALDAGNVYIVQRSGESVGDFTVTEPAQIAGGAWIGQGKLITNEERKKQEEARAKESSTPVKPTEEKDEPPVLRRGGKPAIPTNAPATPPTPAAKEKAPEPAPAPAPKPADDTDRPVLKRGKPEVEQASKLGNETTSIPTAAAAKTPSGQNKLQVAVSDASTDESRPYTWKWSNAEEEQKMRAQIEKLAIAAVADYVAKNGGPKPGKLEDVEIHAFDLDYNNSPDVILSARVLPVVAAAPSRRAASKATSTPVAPPANGFEYYVTIVAREDIYATLQKSFSEVTDSKHLDAYPRLQLIDAVDADGNGAGDLLFRRISDLSTSFVLYRVYASRLEELLRVPEPKL